MNDICRVIGKECIHYFCQHDSLGQVAIEFCSHKGNPDGCEGNCTKRNCPLVVNKQKLLNEPIQQYTRVTFDYLNHKGLHGKRDVIVLQHYFNSAPYHKEKQWILKGFCLTKNAIRYFSVKTITNLKRVI